VRFLGDGVGVTGDYINLQQQWLEHTGASNPNHPAPPHLTPSLTTPPLHHHRSPSQLSLGWFDDDAEIVGGDRIITAGYSTVVDYLYAQLIATGRASVVLNCVVKSVTYSTESRVTVG